MNCSFSTSGPLHPKSAGAGGPVIERRTHRVEFYATAMNGHSIELLPGDRVVIAASHVANGTGDRLSVYDVHRSDWGSTTPRLTPEVVVPLPDINGHDMMPVPGSSQLILATAAHTWLFDRTTHQFTKHPRLGDVPRVKSVHIDTVSQRLLWIQGDGTTWWSDVLRFAHPETTIAVPGEKVYKARWMPRRDTTRPPPA